MFYRFRRIRKVFQVRLHKEFLYEHTLQALPEVARPTSLLVRTLQKEEIHLLRSVWNFNKDQLTKRFDRGDLCYAGFIDNKICSYHWVQYSGLHFFQQVHKHIPVPPDQGWIYHVRVADWAQGRGINSYVYITILRDAIQLGKAKLFIYTNAKNSANQKGLERCGFKKIKEFISLWFWQRYFLIREKVID